MGTINILNHATVGVDMKTHPLFLGNKKLHAATNMVFEEGVFRTRPGFRYHKLNASGQFQGAGLFTPSMGISSQAFGQALAGLVTVAGGKVRVNDTTGGQITCNPVEVDCGEGFICAGEAYVFGAENYLIIQNRNSNTYWWDGVGPATVSPGMDSGTWEDAPVQAIRFTPAFPVANLPDCDRFACSQVSCTLAITDNEVLGANSARFTIFNSGTSAAEVSAFSATPAAGVFFTPTSLTIEAGTGEEVTITTLDYDLTTYDLGVEVANNCGSGSISFTVGVPVVTDCVVQIGEVVVLGPNSATIEIINPGTNAATGIIIIPEDLSIWGASPATPINLGPSASVVVEVTFDSTLPQVFEVRSDCAPPVSGMLEAWGGCELTLHDAFMLDDRNGGFTISNIGSSTATITDLYSPSSAADYVTYSPLPPFTIGAGDSQLVEVTTEPHFVDLRQTTQAVASTCVGSPQQIETPNWP